MSNCALTRSQNAGPVSLYTHVHKTKFTIEEALYPQFTGESGEAKMLSEVKNARLKWSQEAFWIQTRKVEEKPTGRIRDTQAE